MAYISSLLFLLLMIDCTHSFSLYSLFNSSENKLLDKQNSKSIDFQLPLVKRLRRWNKNDNDEVEISLNETILSVDTNTDNISTLDSIINSTLVNSFQTKELNSSIIEILNQLINSTSMTTLDILYSNENTTIVYPLSQQDLTELNQTVIEDNTTIKYSLLRQNLTELNGTIIEDNTTVVYPSLQQNLTELNQTAIEDNTTFVYSLLRQDLTELNQTIIDDNTTVFSEVIYINESLSSVPIVFNQTIDEVESTSSIIEFDNTNTTENNQTNDWNLLVSDELLINSNISNKDAVIINQEINLNDTEIIFDETNQNSNDSSILTSKSLSIPICDQSCQCLKECSYGFEILNDTCICNPPCKNYQCFGNDTCIVTDQGEPLCQPGNGTTHDRPIGCYQPRDAGYHDTNIRYHNRWYYNPDQDTCHLFVYRGLGGNGNNFQTLNECHLECITCAPLPDPGECLGRINMWYYNKKENECKEFEYSGCKGNENKFLKKEQCINTCINRIFNL